MCKCYCKYKVFNYFKVGITFTLQTVDLSKNNLLDTCEEEKRKRMNRQKTTVVNVDGRKVFVTNARIKIVDCARPGADGKSVKRATSNQETGPSSKKKMNPLFEDSVDSALPGTDGSQNSSESQEDEGPSRLDTFEYDSDDEYPSLPPYFEPKKPANLLPPVLEHLTDHVGE